MARHAQQRTFRMQWHRALTQARRHVHDHTRRLALTFLVVTAVFGLGVASPAAFGVGTPTAADVGRTHLTLAPHATTVKWRAAVRLVARLSGTLGPMSGTRVTFWERSRHVGWQQAATVTTDDNGFATLSRALRRSTAWQVRYSGDLLNRPTASPVSHVTVRPRPRPRPSTRAFGVRVVREAARHHGAPYQYGAAGPYRFDCSGFTLYVFGRFGISLPHNAAAQWDDTRHVAPSRKQVGDLIFFHRSGGIYHVGIYAGHGEMWAATHSGDVVRLESIYAAPYLVGRVH